MNLQTIIAYLSSIGTLLSPVWKQLLEGEGELLIIPTIEATQAAAPSLTGAALVTACSGAIKHALRVKLGWAGFFADIAWADSDFVSYLDQVITIAIAGEIPSAPASA
jgi:hypothetical protein